LPIQEERSFVRGKSLKRSASAGRTTSHTRVYRGCSGLAKNIDAGGQDQSNDSAETLVCNSPECHHGTSVDPGMRIFYTRFQGLVLAPPVEIVNAVLGLAGGRRSA
jgi:hypothetical protein